jgi:hypothetical protein
MRLPDTAKPALDLWRNGLPEASLLGSKNGSTFPTKSAPNQAQSRARLRRQRHVECLHRLGPAPLGHFLREIGLGASVAERLERYARPDPDFVHALGGDHFAPIVHVIEGGRHR